jgi:hypothetical protein
MGGSMVIPCYVKMGSDNKRWADPNSQISSKGRVVDSHRWHLEELIGVGILKGLGVGFRILRYGWSRGTEFPDEKRPAYWKRL